MLRLLSGHREIVKDAGTVRESVVAEPNNFGVEREDSGLIGLRKPLLLFVFGARSFLDL